MTDPYARTPEGMLNRILQHQSQVDAWIAGPKPPAAPKVWTITDWNDATKTGFYIGNSADNSPPGVIPFISGVVVRGDIWLFQILINPWGEVWHRISPIDPSGAPNWRSWYNNVVTNEVTTSSGTLNLESRFDAVTIAGEGINLNSTDGVYLNGEHLVTTDWLPASPAPSPGWSESTTTAPFKYKYTMGNFYLSGRVYYDSGPDITTNSYGNVGDQVIGTLPTYILPDGFSTKYFSWHVPGYTDGSGRLETNGRLILCSLAPGFTLSAGGSGTQSALEMTFSWS